MDRGQKAKEYFESGYNCTQAVAMAFSDLTGFDEKTIATIAQPFGGGMGRLREVCGTFSGMLLVLGSLYGDNDPKNTVQKKEIYERVQELAKNFERDNGSIICRELLGLSVKHSEPTPEERTPQYYKKRPCNELAYYAANLLDEYIKNEKSKKED